MRAVVADVNPIRPIFTATHDTKSGLKAILLRLLNNEDENINVQYARHGLDSQLSDPLPACPNGFGQRRPRGHRNFRTFVEVPAVLVSDGEKVVVHDAQRCALAKFIRSSGLHIMLERLPANELVFPRNQGARRAISVADDVDCTHIDARREMFLHFVRHDWQRFLERQHAFRRCFSHGFGHFLR